MASSALDNAESWISFFWWFKLAAAALVTIGVGMEFGGDWLARPFEKTIEDARKLELAELHNESDAAKLETARLSKEAETAKAGIANAQEETAKANKATEQLRRENLDLRSKIAGRRITPEQHGILVAELSKNPGFFHIQSMTDGESALYAADLFKTLKDAQWTSDTAEFPLGEVWHGLVLFQTDDPNAVLLATAFRAADIPFLIGDNQHKKDKATLLVGAKPPPF